LAGMRKLFREEEDMDYSAILEEEEEEEDLKNLDRGRRSCS